MGSTDAQTAYAPQVASMLWPKPAVVTVARKPGRSTPGILRDWFVLPSPTRPRLLVPAGVPSAARMLVRHGERVGPRLARFLLATAVRSGLMDRLPVSRLRVTAADGTGTDLASVESRLADVLGEQVATGVLLGTPRANRKPVLQVFGSDGRTLAFVKVGCDDVTRGLVRREAANLRRLEDAELRLIEAPRIVYAGAFTDLELLVLSPMSTSQQKRRVGPPPLPAMRDLACSLGTTVQPLRESAFWAALTGACAGVVTSPLAGQLADTLGSAGERYGDRQLQFASWHGDWAPWNMGVSGDRVQLWDWERFSDAVPLGFDAVHYRAQQVRHNLGGLRQAEDQLRAELPNLLAGVGVDNPQGAAPVILTLYLLQVSSRYLGPGADIFNGGPHPRARWALDFAGRVAGG